MKLINRFSKADIRAYFFYIDHKGLLYLEETEQKNFTSCIKDIRFFNFFHKNLTRNTTEYYQEYPYVSKCWGEYNFIKSYNNPIVFNDLKVINEKFTLTTPNGYQEMFNPRHLFQKNGVIHHTVTLNDLKEGIFSSELSIQLSELIQGNILIWQGFRYLIYSLD